MNYHSNALETTQWSLEIDLKKDLESFMEKQGALVEEFDEGLWSSLVQEVVVKSKDDILFIFKNGFKIKTR